MCNYAMPSKGHHKLCVMYSRLVSIFKGECMIIHVTSYQPCNTFPLGFDPSIYKHLELGAAICQGSLFKLGGKYIFVTESCTQALEGGIGDSCSLEFSHLDI